MTTPSIGSLDPADLTPTAPGTSIGDSTNAQNTAAAYLDALGAPLTTANIESMIDWFEAEDDNQPTGGNATGVGGNDPLDLAAGYGDAANYIGVVGQNSAGGQALENLATPEDGATDWALAMTTGPYPGIVAALKSGAGLIGNSSLASEFLNYSGNGYDGLPAAYSGGTYGTSPSDNATLTASSTPGAATGTTGSTGTTAAGPTSASAVAAAGGFDPLSLLSDFTGLARDLATVIDYAFGMFGRGQGWRVAFTVVFAVSGYGAYKCLAGAGAVPDMGNFKLAVV
jgi:hypothetical protein